MTLSIFLVCSAFNTIILYSMENSGRGTRAVAMANAFTAVSDNPWAVNYNPAGLTQIKNIQCSAFIIPNQFGLQELRTAAFAAAVPAGFASFGLKTEIFGFDLYKETEIGMSCAFKFDQNFSGGLSANLHRFDIERYGCTQNIIFDGGLLARVADDVKVGFDFKNILGMSIANSDEKYPQLFSLGLCWSPLCGLIFALEMEKDVRYPASIKCGIEQIIMDVLALQAGVANNPEKYSAGISLKLSFCEFGYACYSHFELGWTHQIEISCFFGN